jgi:hypothetical protein
MEPPGCRGGLVLEHPRSEGRTSATGKAMSPRTLFLGAAAIMSLAISAGPTYAFTEGEVIRMHDACLHGDRAACEHRNVAIHDHEHETEWRRVHPDWYR